MPVIVRKRRGRYRVVEKSSGRLARSSSKSKPSDGGGHASKAKAERQARAINAAWSRKRRR
jgi:hypothetical protein